ncbi:SdpI family protein [Pseudonocardia spinosispora]|uniref:SdpI family protein n=1 Tax=Pseudonocardia spinosispora TaxID=103441 RepID=UPI0007E8EA7F|nr:SdpI family protein [Pseudonocardia spinosispora]
MVGSASQVAAVVVAAGGLALVSVGVLGARRRLPRNRFAGVRTVNTLRDDETFAVGNQVSAPLTIGGGAVAVLGGLATLAANSTALAITLLALTVLGTLGLMVAGGVLGDRAAKQVPMPTLGGCSGVCTGCSLVEGCGGGTASNTEQAGTEQAAAQS